jgi:hypothetical protein
MEFRYFQQVQDMQVQLLRQHRLRELLCRLVILDSFYGVLHLHLHRLRQYFLRLLRQLLLELQHCLFL